MRWGLKSPENPLRTPKGSHQGGDWLPSPGKIEEGAARGRAGPLSGPQRPADPSGPDIMPACYLFHGAPRPLLLRWLVVRPRAVDEKKKKQEKGTKQKRPNGNRDPPSSHLWFFTSSLSLRLSLYSHFLCCFHGVSETDSASSFLFTLGAPARGALWCCTRASPPVGDR